MKRFLLIAILGVFIGTTTNAQLTIEFHGIDVTNQEVLFDSLFVNQDLDHHFDIVNHYGEDIDVTFLRFDECPPSSFTHLFCFGMHCFGPVTMTCEEPIVSGASEDFHPTIMLSSNETGYAFRYTFYKTDAIADSVYFIVRKGACGENLVSINDKEIENSINVFPNPANTQATINYDLQNNEGSLVIRNIIGKEVKTVELNREANSQVINTSDLPSGTYICTVVSEGRNIKSMKLIVNH